MKTLQESIIGKKGSKTRDIWYTIAPSGWRPSGTTE